MNREENMSAGPRATIPEPLRGIDPDSFAYRTITKRFIDITQRVLDQYEWPTQAIEGLATLMAEIPFERLRLLSDPNSPDAHLWEVYLGPYLGQNWLEPPWFAVEMYFFRRILEATGYFSAGQGNGIDPYRVLKRKGLEDALISLAPVCNHLAKSSANPPESPSGYAGLIAGLVHEAIWGNQADLSIWPDADGGQPTRPDVDRLTHHLLIDQAKAASDYLVHQAKQPARCDFILDNVGMELAYDLVLVDFLLSHNLVYELNFHLKPYPTYVSDATIQDVLEMAEAISNSGEESVSAMGQRLKKYLQENRWKLKDHYYWTSPLSGWEMPDGLRSELKEADLVISKGDANYRRWLGDRHWDFSTPLENVLNYIPAPMLCLRVLKSNVLIGMEPGGSEKMDKTEPDWLYNGNWGVIQFFQPQAIGY